VGLIVATLGARRRGAKGGKDGGGGWGCSRGPFYRAEDREAGGRGSNRQWLGGASRHDGFGFDFAPKGEGNKGATLVQEGKRRGSNNA
jgi:hypothetical protein